MNAEIQEVLEGKRRWCVVCADNAEVLPALPDKSVAHVITDPPYEAEAHTLQRRSRVKGGKHDGGEYADGLYGCALEPLSFAPITAADRERAAAEFARIGAGWVLAFCQAEAVAAWRSALTGAGASWARAMVWVKPDATPQFTGDRPAQGYESVATAWSGAGRMRWNGGGRRGVFVYSRESDLREHDTPKPLPLMLELVELFTDPDEVILDPFCGSGTTGVACLRLGRRFIGIERDEKYAAIARERLAAESQGLTLRDARAGQISLFGEVA